MSDPPDFDPCECVWNHELAMRRLISLLRSSQSYCTDTQCDDIPGLQGPPQNEGNMPFFIICWVVLAMALFFLRPGSIRPQGDRKHNDNQEFDPRPPNPPTAN